VAPEAGAFFDLEDPRDLARLGEPTLSLSGRPGTVVLDEAQRSPDLFPALRVLIDEDRHPGRFLVLGSASPDLIGMASESLAGRVEILELPGFRAQDVGETGFDELWLRGGLPPSFTASDAEMSARWRDAYITTFLERDLTVLGFRLPSTTMRRFWTMLAHYHGQTWNGAELARALAISEPSVRRYLDALTDALVVRQLAPWYANLSKRQVRAPKVYIRDTGLLHALLGVTDETALFRHPKVGASWEGFVIEQLLTLLEPRDPSFWATHAGAELDLRLEMAGQRIGVEIKRTDRPTVTPSIRSALADLELDHVYVLHAGATPRFPLSPQVTAIPARNVLLAGASALRPSPP
jgi:predicted AAA+ superfamily ATPase